MAVETRKTLAGTAVKYQRDPFKLGTKAFLVKKRFITSHAPDKAIQFMLINRIKRELLSTTTAKVLFCYFFNQKGLFVFFE